MNCLCELSCRASAPRPRPHPQRPAELQEQTGSGLPIVSLDSFESPYYRRYARTESEYLDLEYNKLFQDESI
jgi:hypothetical protein